MKSILLIATLFISLSSYATMPRTSAKCFANATANAEAVARIMYQEKGLATNKTTLLSSDVLNKTYLIYTSDSSAEPLHCNYRVQMMNNVTDDCWMSSIEQTECSQ